jgi:hypothetical protein
VKGEEYVVGGLWEMLVELEEMEGEEVEGGGS